MAALLSLLLAGCDVLHPLKFAAVGRKPDALEYQYHFLASWMRSEKPCFLIGHDALTFAPWSSPQTRYSYLRSDCFKSVAYRTRRKELCNQIRDVPAWVERRDVATSEVCRQQAGQGRIGYGTTTPDLRILLPLMDYEEDEIEALATDRWTTISSEEFFYRIDRLTHFGREEDKRELAALRWQPPPPPEPMFTKICTDRDSADDEDPVWVSVPIPDPYVHDPSRICVLQASPDWRRDQEGEDEPDVEP